MKPLTPKTWLERIDRSKRAQEDLRKEALQYHRAYQGDYTFGTGKARKREKFRDEMNVNAIYAMVELITPSIFGGQPRVIADERSPRFAPYSKNYQEVVNYWARELGGREEFMRCLFDSFFGYAAIEVGWHYETRVYVEKQRKQVQSVDGSIVEIEEDVNVEKTVKDQPFLRWRNPFDVLLDPDVPRRKDARFMVIRDIVTYNYFLDMPKIPDELKAKVKPTHRPEDEADKMRSGEDDDRRKDMRSDSEWVELYWIWCRESEKRYLVTPQVKDQYLLEEPWPYWLEYKDDPFPVTIMDGKTDNCSPYTFSEIRPLWDHIIERNRLRTAFLVHMKRSIPRYVYGKGTGTRSQISKLFTARIDEAVELNNPAGLSVAPTTEMPPELWRWDQMVQDDFLNVSSLSEYRNEGVADTATEASIIEGRSSVRKSKRRKEFEEFMCSALAKLGMLCQQFMDAEVAIKIDTQNGNQWKTLTKADIQGEFVLNVEPGSTEPKNEIMHRQQVLKFAETMANNPHTNQRALAEELAKTFGFSSDKILLPAKAVEAKIAAQGEPSVKIKDVDINDIPDPNAKAMIVSKAMEDAGIEAAQAESEEPMEGSPLDIQEDLSEDINGGIPVEPVGGRLGLEPVEAQQVIQPGSESGTAF